MIVKLIAACVRFRRIVIEVILAGKLCRHAMSSFIKTVTFDCADSLVTARFWAATLGSNVHEDSTPDKAYVEADGNTDLNKLIELIYL